MICFLLSALLVFQTPTAANPQTTEISFTSHDGHPMLGKLTAPKTDGPYAVVIYVQTAEGIAVTVFAAIFRTFPHAFTPLCLRVNRNV